MNFLEVFFILVLVLVVILSLNAYFNHIKQQKNIELNQLIDDVKTAYFKSFDSPNDAEITTEYTETIEILMNFIKENEFSFPNNTYEIEERKVANQQHAITIHKRYLDKLIKLRNDVQNTELLTSWLNDGSALRSHLGAKFLENSMRFATTKALHIADIRRERYQHALDALKRNPTNPDLHTHALQMGREYAESTRAEGVVTLFDETALANDIRAVTANAAQVSAIDNTQGRPAQAASLDERIAALLKLKAAGLLSDAEFEQKRQELIDAV